MRTSLWFSLVGLVVSAASIGCSTTPESSATGAGSGGAAPAAATTYYKDVEPLLQKHCQSCHSPGRIAPFALTTYQEAKTVGPDMVAQTKSLAMPPWGARDTAECTTRFGWQNDERLSDAEIKTFAAWAASGMVEGDPKDAPPKVELPPTELTHPTANLKPVKPFTASGDDDEFRCFRLDPELSHDVYVNGTNIIPGDPKVVHHALIFADPNDESASLAGKDGSYSCFGGPGIDDTSLVAAWAPGGIPNDLPDNIGLELTKGTKLVMQVHYHPAGTTGLPDATTFQMRYTTKVPEYLALPVLAGNFDSPVDSTGDGLLPGPDDHGKVQFMIPPDKSAHTEDMQFKIPDDGMGNPLPDLMLYGTATHMHYVGTDMRITVDRASENNGDPKTECLIEEPAWDFNWQRFYAYDAPIDELPQLHTGDTVHLHCSYDNTLQNPFVVTSLMQQHLTAPQTVRLGETTADEMCLGGFIFLMKL